MKKHFPAFCLMLSFLFASEINAQIFDTDAAVVDVGIGITRSYGAGFGVPALLARFDKGIVDDLGPGNLGAGGILAVKFTPGSFNSRYTNFHFGVRAHYHPHWIMENVDGLDVYAGVTTGLRLQRYNSGSSTPTKTTNLWPFFGPIIGARYYFADAIGVFAEGSAGLYEPYFLSGGVSFKF